MNRILLTFFILIIIPALTFGAADITGVVKDSKSNETLVGSSVYIKELKKGTTTGLDGSFRIKNIPKGNYTLEISYIGYSNTEIPITVPEKANVGPLDIQLDPVLTKLDDVVVRAQKDQSTDISARSSERVSPNMMNVVSSRTIELSPDIDVASVVQRMSGVTLDKSSSGSGQYALLRGMDKRYSYTLINGIKIPSTNDKHRYVSLDIFPSELEDRVEVSKVLTPDMEGDAIAGVINLVMKNAPERFTVQGNASVGYSGILADNQFQSFDKSVIHINSPYELNGSKYYAVSTDFPKKNLDPMPVKLPMNRTAGFSIGDRFFNKRLGWILAASYNESYKGTHSLIFDESQSTDGTNLPILTSMQHRFDYDYQQSYGIHNKLDLVLADNHTLQLYLAYMNFGLTQVRTTDETEFGNNSYDPAHGSENDSHSERNRTSMQQLLNTTLQGNHTFWNHLLINWSTVYSKATNQTPDMSTVAFDETYVNHVLQPEYIDFSGIDRLWLHNTDEDKAAYLNFKYRAQLFGGNAEFSTGGLYRDKKRKSFYNDYTLMPKGPVDAHSAKGVDWNNYSDINWTVVDPLGAVNTAGTFNAYETVDAGYSMFLYKISKFRFIGGVRYEFSAQGYDEVFHNAFLDKYKPGNNQKRDHQYRFWLPSANMEYNLNEKNNLKLAYYKAINKPGFLEIVPYMDNTGDYPKTGNPDLKNAVADNIDLRYEYFPNALDQLLAGAFYKKINDAIEEGFYLDGHGNYLLSTFNSNATNYGIELDVVKFFREFGIKANYTWTHSSTSSYKRSQVNGVVNRDSTVSSLEYRPLFGQSENVGNISLLYRGSSNGFNAQLAMSYTGERIYKVSTDINGDLWQKAFWQMDLSCEQKLGKHIGIFIKARNLLNTHVNVFLKQFNQINEQFPYHTLVSSNTPLRDEYSGTTYLLGIRYKFN